MQLHYLTGKNGGTNSLEVPDFLTFLVYVYRDNVARTAALISERMLILSADIVFGLQPPFGADKAYALVGVGTVSCAIHTFKSIFINEYYNPVPVPPTPTVALAYVSI